MTNTQIRRIRRALEDKGFSLAKIARRCNVTRQSVSRVLRQPEQSAPIRSTIVEILGRDPWARRKSAA